MFIQDNGNISISKITREKMLKRQQEIMKEVEERRLSKERDLYLQQSAQEQTKEIDPESQMPAEVALDDTVKEQELPTEPAITENEISNSILESVKPQSPTKQNPLKISQSIQQNKRIASAQRKGIFF